MSERRVRSGGQNAAAEALRQALETIGIAGRIEVYDRLAVLIASDSDVLQHSDVRKRALLLAREHGFTNLALEIRPDTTSRASISRD
jgi:hypothetical protein